VFFLYQVFFKAEFKSGLEEFGTIIRPKIEKIRDIKIIPGSSVKEGRKPVVEDEAEPIGFTVIVLKDGRELEGRIIKETEDRIEFSLNLSQGRVVMNLDKSKIASIEHNLPKESF
jgi:hypothetical protein